MMIQERGYVGLLNEVFYTAVPLSMEAHLEYVTSNVDAAINEMGEKQRFVIVHCFGLMGKPKLSQNIIAEKLGLTASTVSSHKTNAIIALRRKGVCEPYRERWELFERYYRPIGDNEDVAAMVFELVEQYALAQEQIRREQEECVGERKWRLKLIKDIQSENTLYGCKLKKEVAKKLREAGNLSIVDLLRLKKLALRAVLTHEEIEIVENFLYNQYGIRLEHK